MKCTVIITGVAGFVRKITQRVFMTHREDQIWLLRYL